MSRKRRSRGVVEGRLPWKKSLLYWTSGIGMGGHRTYAHEEYGNLYQIEPVDPTGRVYCCQFTGPRAALTVKYLTPDGGVSPTIVLFKGSRAAEAAHRAAVKHYERFRSSNRAKDMFAGAFPSKFRRV